MEPFLTDLGTLQLITFLDRSAAIRLAAFLEECDALRTNNPSAAITFTAVDFVGRPDVTEMKLDRKIGRDRKILSTVKLANGALWRRGQLRIPGVELPDTLRESVKGRLIEEIVGNPPFTGFEVNGAVQDGTGADGSLRIRCTAEKVAEIAVDVEAAPMRSLEDLERLASAHVEERVDPVAAHVLGLLPRRETLIAIVRCAEQTRSGILVRLPLKYSQILSKDAPARFKGTGTKDDPNVQPDILHLKRSKAGYQIDAYAVVPAEKIGGADLAAFIENGMTHGYEGEGGIPADAGCLERLGFDVPGISFATKTKWVYGSLTSRDLLPVRTIGEALTPAA